MRAWQVEEAQVRGRDGVCGPGRWRKPRCEGGMAYAGLAGTLPAQVHVCAQACACVQAPAQRATFDDPCIVEGTLL